MSRLAPAACTALLLSCAPPDATEQPFAEVLDVVPVVASFGDGWDLFNATHVQTLSDGRIAVLNAGSSEVLVFSADGRLERKFGGAGRGPGELTLPQFLGVLPGDSILVTEVPIPQRTTVFTPDGAVVRTFELEMPEDRAWYVFPHGITSDRALVGSLGFEEPAGSGPGVVRMPLTVVVHDLDGHLLHVVERPEIHREFFIVESERAPRIATPPPQIHGRSASGSSGFAMAQSLSREVLVFGSDGAVRHTLQLPEPPAVGTSRIDELRNAWVDEATTEESRALRRRAAAEAPRPATPHVVGDLRIDLFGRLWVREANLEGAPVARWHVFERGALLGHVDIPADLEAREIGADYLLGVVRNELDVETIVRVRLRTL